MIFNFIFNFIMFFTVLNFSWLIEKGYNHTSRDQLVRRTGIPLFLAIVLSAIDSFKIAFFYQLILFVIIVLLGYYFYRFKWKR